MFRNIFVSVVVLAWILTQMFQVRLPPNPPPPPPSAAREENKVRQDVSFSKWRHDHTTSWVLFQDSQWTWLGVAQRRTLIVISKQKRYRMHACWSPNRKLAFLLKPLGSNQVIIDFSRSVEGPNANHKQGFSTIRLRHNDRFDYATDNADMMCKTLLSTRPANRRITCSILTTRKPKNPGRRNQWTDDTPWSSAFPNAITCFRRCHTTPNQQRQRDKCVCLFFCFRDSVNVQKITPSYTEEQENKNMAMAREMKKAHWGTASHSPREGLGNGPPMSSTQESDRQSGPPLIHMHPR